MASTLALTSVADSALALTAASHVQQTERIEVTGSLTRQIDAETVQSAFRMTQAEFQKSGLITVGNIISSMSASARRPSPRTRF